MEACAGCGIQTTGEHPFVGIGRENLETGEGDMVQYPVCEPCWRDPAHRVHPLKMHFHKREHADVGLRAAKTTDKLSKSGADIGVTTS